MNAWDWIELVWLGGLSLLWIWSDRVRVLKEKLEALGSAKEVTDQ